MKLHGYQVPRKIFDALATGGGGRDAVYVLAEAEYSKHKVLLWGVRDLAAGTCSPDETRMVRHGYDLLAAVQRYDSASAAATIRHPGVGAWALHAVRAIRDGASHDDVAMVQARPGQLSAVAAAAAIRAKMRVEIEIPASKIENTSNGDKSVILPSLGVAMVRSSTAIVRVDGDDAMILSAGRCVNLPRDPCRDAPGWYGLRRLRMGNLNLLIDDIDPFRMPAMTSMAPRLSTAAIAKWGTTLEQAWSLLTKDHSDVAAEVAETINTMVPLVAQGEIYASSSSPEAFGAIAMSEPPDQYECAVTLVHEAQHLKLSALTDIVAMTLQDDGRRYYAPWRPDPRPISGLLQGAYAHLGVGRFWRRQRQVGVGAINLKAHIEFARWRTATAQVVDTLMASGQLTAAGYHFVREMGRTLGSWQNEPVPAEAQRRANQEAETHLDRWRRDNGSPKA
jgi:uncharacterized protein